VARTTWSGRWPSWRRIAWSGLPKTAGEPVLAGHLPPRVLRALEFRPCCDRTWRPCNRSSNDTLPPIIACESAEETYYVAHRIRAATSLGELLQDRGAVSFVEGFTIVAELLRSCSAAHGAGFLHGDLGPDQVLLRPTGI